MMLSVSAVSLGEAAPEQVSYSSFMEHLNAFLSGLDLQAKDVYMVESAQGQSYQMLIGQNESGTINLMVGENDEEIATLQIDNEAAYLKYQGSTMAIKFETIKDFFENLPNKLLSYLKTLGIDPEKIEVFVSSSLGRRMAHAAQEKKLWREQPFVIGKKASEIRADWSDDETILIQGIIDAFFLEEDQVVLVDYKSDRARNGEEESLVRRYREQFRIYADALEKLLMKKVKEAWLYSLSLGKAIPVSLSDEEQHNEVD